MVEKQNVICRRDVEKTMKNLILLLAVTCCRNFWPASMNFYNDNDGSLYTPVCITQYCSIFFFHVQQSVAICYILVHIPTCISVIRTVDVKLKQ